VEGLLAWDELQRSGDGIMSDKLQFVVVPDFYFRLKWQRLSEIKSGVALRLPRTP